MAVKRQYKEVGSFPIYSRQDEVDVLSTAMMNEAEDIRIRRCSVSGPLAKFYDVYVPAEMGFAQEYNGKTIDEKVGLDSEKYQLRECDEVFQAVYSILAGERPKEVRLMRSSPEGKWEYRLYVRT